jgi:hypothetical protein
VSTGGGSGDGGHRPDGGAGVVACRRPPPARGDQGSVLVEAAIVLPLLFSLIFGILEIGSALKSYSGAANAVRAGGRMASVAGSDASADQRILERMAREATGIADGEIEYVVIWHATSTGEEPPTGPCKPAPSATVNEQSAGVGDGGNGALGACNVYHRPADPGGAFDMATGRAAEPPEYYFGCSGPDDDEAGHKVDCNWPGRNRRTSLTPRGEAPPQGETGRPDYLGVHLRASHSYVTGVLGDTLTITDSGVNLLEPHGYSVSE